MEKKLTLLAARDKNADGSGDVWLYQDKPHCEKVGGDHVFFGDVWLADATECFGNIFDDITFEDSPVEVELTIKIKE